MNTKEILLEDIKDLIKLGYYLHNNLFDFGYPDEIFGDRDFFTFKTGAESFILRLYDQNHPYYKNFIKFCQKNDLEDLRAGIGILKAIEVEIENDLIISIKNIASAEIFTDFFEMAEYLLNEGYKDPAAVLIGGILESHLRLLCEINDIDTKTEKDGKILYMKASKMNDILAKKVVYNKLMHKTIISWLDLRNKAAHGKYEEYNKEQVELMLQGVQNFINEVKV